MDPKSDDKCSFKNTEEKVMGDRGRDWSDVPTSPGWPRLAGSTRGRREAWKGFGTELPEEHTLPTPGLWASGLLNYEIINFCSFQPLSMWSFVIAHPGNLTRIQTFACRWKQHGAEGKGEC